MMRQYARLSACQAQRDRLCSGSCISHCAAVAELVDATDSKSVSGDRVGVRFPSAAPSLKKMIGKDTLGIGIDNPPKPEAIRFYPVAALNPNKDNHASYDANSLAGNACHFLAIAKRLVQLAFE